MVDMRLEGADRLADLGQQLKSADKTIRSELYRSLNRAVKPLRERAKDTPRLHPGLPRSGGLAPLVESSLHGRGGVKTKRRTGRKTAGITITGQSSGHDIRAMNRGRLRHPTWGRAPWVDQRITRGFWEKPLEDESPEVRREVIAIMDDILRRIV